MARRWGGAGSGREPHTVDPGHPSRWRRWPPERPESPKRAVARHQLKQRLGGRARPQAGSVAPEFRQGENSGKAARLVSSWK